MWKLPFGNLESGYTCEHVGLPGLLPPCGQQVGRDKERQLSESQGTTDKTDKHLQGPEDGGKKPVMGVPTPWVETLRLLVLNRTFCPLVQALTKAAVHRLGREYQPSLRSPSRTFQQAGVSPCLQPSLSTHRSQLSHRQLQAGLLRAPSNTRSFPSSHLPSAVPC